MPKKTKAIKPTDSKKAWNKRKQNERKYAPSQNEKEKTFLIICEGVNTEPEYFKSFPVTSVAVKSYGLGMTKMALVKMVTDTVKALDNKNQEVWVVFDMDISLENETQQFEDYNNAIAVAQKQGFKVAYSNDAFELWFLLHYQFLENKWTRYEYYQKLSQWWNCNYETIGKNFNFSQGIYKKLHDDERASQISAIAFATRLLEAQKDKPFSERNPCTTVFELVIELNQYI
jgi:hypothetical protein